MAWNHVFLKNKFILYGQGISNKLVEEFFVKNNVTYKIVTDYQDIKDNWVIIKSPGIDNDTKFLKDCNKKNLLIINDIELFYILRPEICYIGVTGSFGKTTTCTLLYNIMKEKYNVKVCGNIGIPIFSYIDLDVNYLIVELSSYQLEYINIFKPNYFIVLNIFNHHLNHHKSVFNYASAKLKPLLNMDKDDVFIYNDQITPYLERRKINCKIFCYSKDYTIDCSNVNFNQLDFFKYDFNKENFSSIFILLKLLNVNEELIFKKVKEFKMLSHRMEEIYNHNELVIINDSKSTGFNSLEEGINYCLNNFNLYELLIIIGGKIDLEEIRENLKFIKTLNKYNIYCYGENKMIISKLINCNYYDNLKDVINSINFHKQMVILFSPSAQSFDDFLSYEDRGNKFKELIFKKLKL